MFDDVVFILSQFESKEKLSLFNTFENIIITHFFLLPYDQKRITNMTTESLKLNLNCCLFPPTSYPSKQRDVEKTVSSNSDVRSV